MRRILVVLAACWLPAAGALADGPAAIVEAVKSPEAGVNFLEYVDKGRVIELGPKGTLVLGYLRSCITEKITGGSVRIGTDQSVITGGRVVRERVECDGGKIYIILERARSSGMVLFRQPGGGGATPAFTIYGTSPVIVPLAAASTMVIQRLDDTAQVMSFNIKGDFIDLLAQGKALQPGKLYRIIARRRRIIFKVSDRARVGPGPLLGRLVSF